MDVRAHECVHIQVVVVVVMIMISTTVAPPSLMPWLAAGAASDVASPQ